MMKNYQWFFLALLVSAQNLLAQQVTIIQQNQIPVASITDQVALQTSANDPSIYVFQEVPDFIQGAVIDLWQPEPPQPYEIHLVLASSSRNPCQGRNQTFPDAGSQKSEGNRLRLQSRLSQQSGLYALKHTPNPLSRGDLTAQATPRITFPSAEGPSVGSCEPAKLFRFLALASRLPAAIHNQLTQSSLSPP